MLDLTWIPGLLDEAGQIALRSFRTSLDPIDKGGRHGYDPVTEADRDIENLLRARLSERFGDHEIVGEEAGTSGPSGRYRWLIDPIDGTRAFVTGSPLWGILLGLLDDGRPVSGWMHQPYLGETFAGINGEAWLTHHHDRTQLVTRRGIDLDEATIYTTSPASFTTHDEADAFARLADVVRMARFGGDCYAYCLLAMGQIDLVVEASLQPYDIVPLIPIIEAAGGVVTGRYGESAVGGGFVIAAANDEIHEQACAVLNAGGSSRLREPSRPFVSG